MGGLKFKFTCVGVVGKMKRSCTMMAGSASTAVIVRAGGVDFRTSRQTLEHGGRGYFAALLQHQSLEHVEVGGETLPLFEVDRDPDLFRVVLAWLRSHRLPSAVATDKHMLEDLEPEAAFFAIEDLAAMIHKSLVPLQRAAEPLRAFSLTAGVVMLGSVGSEVDQAVLLAPHEYCMVSHATCTTQGFHIPRAHHSVYCGFEERELGSEDKCWAPVVPRASFDRGKEGKAHYTGRALLASFVYKHVGRGDDDEAAVDEVSDGVCAPLFSQRLNVILGPRGVHNPASTPAGDATNKQTRLTFGSLDSLGFYDGTDNGATWSIFGVVGPAEKVIELYAARSG